MSQAEPIDGTAYPDPHDPVSDLQLSRIQGKVSRLADEYEAYAKFRGSDIDEVLSDLISIRDMNREQFLDLGLLIYLKAIKLKLAVFQHVQALQESDKALFERTEATLSEIEDFYRSIEEEREIELQRLREDARKEEPLIPPLAEAADPDIFELDSGADAWLFKRIAGFFEGDALPVGSGVVDIPQELLELTQSIDMQQLQDDILAKVKAGIGSVRRLAEGFLFRENKRLTLCLVFMACLFLSMAGNVNLEQGEGDILVTYT